MTVFQWTAPNISQICLEQATPLTQCSQTGFLYLTLLGLTYGQPVEQDDPYHESETYYEYTESTKSPIFNTNEKYVSDPESNVQKRNQLPFKTDGKIQNYTSKNQIQSHDNENEDANYDAGQEKTRKKEEPEVYDFIIVGGGSAGCVLANRLSEVNQWKVLLLEAGPDEPEITSVPSLTSVLPGSNIDWGYRTQPEETSCRGLRGKTCVWPRGKTMGGSSSINYMLYIRGNKADYDGWVEAGNPGWSYNEVLPYFKKAENNSDIFIFDKYYHSTEGPLKVGGFPNLDNNIQMLVQAYTEKGLPITDFNGKNQYGTNIPQSTTFNGKRLSVNSAYIKPIRNIRQNLKIITQAYVTRIIIDPSTKTAMGIEYLRNEKKLTAYASKEVISSAGSINSPKLLMLSGIGPEEHLNNLNIPVLSNLKVGHNLQDHVSTDALVVPLANKTSTSVDILQLLDEVYHYYKQPSSKQGPLASASMINSVAFIMTEFSNNNLPDIEIHCVVKQHVEEFLSDPSTYTATDILPVAFYNGISPKPTLLVPKSRGYILLNDTDPVFGAPLIYPRTFTEREDLDRLISAMKFVVSLEETDSFKKNGAVFVKTPFPGCEEFQWGTDEYFSCILIYYTYTLNHQCGTCKMGPIWDPEAVVDARLRVYGIKKLRVVDAAVMPFIVRGNLNAPTVMIAEKAADMIKRDHFKG